MAFSWGTRAPPYRKKITVVMTDLCSTVMENKKIMLHEGL
uniref:Uncharacterized protein n=1 Tax=uncultured bacterium contig00013 TaxID=1181504 RepID=A0A806K0T5_9BACT|nr:hypothetical protein [uncultured bacterium contig00013]